MTHQNASAAVSPIGGHVVATIVGGGIRSAVGISRSRRSIGPVPVAPAIAAVSCFERSCWRYKPRRDLRRRENWPGRHARDHAIRQHHRDEADHRRCRAEVPPRPHGAAGQRQVRPTNRRGEHRRRLDREEDPGTEAWRRTSEHRRRTRRWAELRQCSIGCCDDGSEQYARGQGEKVLRDILVYPSV